MDFLTRVAAGQECWTELQSNIEELPLLPFTLDLKYLYLRDVEIVNSFLFIC